MGKSGSIFRYADRIDNFLMLFGTLGSIGDGMMTPLTMLLLSDLINDYGTSISAPSNYTVDKYSLRLAILGIVVGLSAFIEGICWTRTAERQTSRMRMEYLKSVLKQEVGYFDKQDASSTTFQVISTITSDAHAIQDTIAEKIPNTLAHLSSFFISIPIAFVLSWRLAMAALPFSVMFVIPAVVFGNVLKDLGSKMNNAYGVAGGIAEQALSSIRTVYSYVGEHQTVDRFSSALSKSMELGIKQGFIKGLLFGSVGMMMYIAWACQSWVGSILVIEKGEKGSRVFLSEICVIWGAVSIMSALPNFSYILEATAAASRIFQMTDRIPLIDFCNIKGKILAHVRGKIEFKDVHFSYPSRPDTSVLQEFNLTIRAGKTVGLVGGSGSGKSTIVSLLERFYDPLKGNILLDGHDIMRFHLKWLRSQMGLVNQEPVLFATTIKENILMGREDSPMELVINAAKTANAHDFIVKLPEGYETQVGQFGVQLSGGQKQRIAIARALIRDPRIFLLDEATSALDSQSERIVQEALDQASIGRTTIIIAHRLSTIYRADLIVVLQSGRVVESGSHEELIHMNNGEGGAYKKMVQLQLSTMQNEASNASDHSTEYRKCHEILASWTPQRTRSMRSSWYSSPEYQFSPVYSISITPSSHIHPFNSDTDESSSNIPYPPLSLWRLLQMNAPEWKQALLGCIGAAVVGAIQAMQSFCMGTILSIYFISDIATLKSQARLYCLIFASTAVGTFITKILQQYNFSVMGECLTKRVREKLLGKILTFEIGWFDQDENTSSAICARLATEANMFRSFIAERISLLVQVFFSAALAYVLGLVTAWRLAIVVISIQPFVIGSFYSRSVLMKSMSKKAQKAQREGSQLASEATINHRTITAFSSQKRIIRLFKATMERPKKESIRQSWISVFGLFSSQFMTTAGITFTFWYGGRLMNKELVTSKQIFQTFFVLMSTGKTIADAGSMTSDLAKGASAIRSIFTILDRQSEIEPEDPEGIEIKKTLQGHIELKNVFFSYPARPDQMIFKGLSLNIEARRTMALVGQSGSGKSTIIGLIERFYDPLKGSILIDKRDIKNYNLRQLRSHIALVNQEPTLFAGTIHENILWGKEDATEAEVRKAAALANAHEFISSMKDGYETYCGERGVLLSGGQKQRIVLARAILKNPPILLLDEATSALDSVSEALVQEALDKMMLGSTCVAVAHRLSTIQKADTIAVIKNGQVVEQGNHHDLLAIGANGAYYSLINLQSNHSTY
ncbi:putative multidrug resistance protein isoform X1 [Ziziphus jujuba]|uniref:Multidrug resistance protein isoform X1 n=3 Tax=Ziziphus jujuba TaxID=326968 RepID=A0A6P4AG52_ZIZJJ|nr:putative multidrug resistance protein isoform X1 [Ziziphus jujuba]